MSIRRADRKSTVYLATNRKNGKHYVGITCLYLSQRRANHASVAKRGAPTHFAKSIRRHGIDAFKFEALAVLDSYDAAKEMEIWLIAQMRPEYNSTNGGDGYLGYVPTDEARRKISEANTGRTGYWKGRLPPSFEAFRRGYAAMPKEKKRAILALGPKSQQRKIVCLNDGMVYESITEAANAYGIDSSSITAVCKKSSIRKTVGGRVFRYFGDHQGGLTEAVAVAKSAKLSQVSGFRKWWERNGESATS